MSVIIHNNIFLCVYAVMENSTSHSSPNSSQQGEPKFLENRNHDSPIPLSSDEDDGSVRQNSSNMAITPARKGNDL